VGEGYGDIQPLVLSEGKDAKGGLSVVEEFEGDRSSEHGELKRTSSSTGCCGIVRKSYQEKKAIIVLQGADQSKGREHHKSGLEKGDRSYLQKGGVNPTEICQKKSMFTSVQGNSLKLGPTTNLKSNKRASKKNQ